MPEGFTVSSTILDFLTWPLFFKIDTVFMLLQEVEVYKEHVLAQQLMEQILNFVDKKGNTVLQLGAIVKVLNVKGLMNV